MSVLHLLSAGNYIVVNRTLINTYGLNAAVMLGELASECLYWSEREAVADGWFYSTIENVEHNTGLTAYEQRFALNKLAEAGLVEVKRRGMPAKRFIRIDGDAVVKNFNNLMLKNLTTSDQKISHQEVKKLNTNNNKEKKNNKKELSVYVYDATLDADVMIANNPELRASFVAFIKMRAFIKHPLDEGGVERIIAQVRKLGNGDADTMREILDQSIRNTWRGVFPLKEARGVAGTTTTSGTTTNEFDALLEKEGINDAN